jgi:hypothetical protein
MPEAARGFAQLWVMDGSIVGFVQVAGYMKFRSAKIDLPSMLSSLLLS